MGLSPPHHDAVRERCQRQHQRERHGEEEKQDFEDAGGHQVVGREDEQPQTRTDQQGPEEDRVPGTPSVEPERHAEPHRQRQRQTAVDPPHGSIRPR